MQGCFKKNQSICEFLNGLNDSVLITYGEVASIERMDHERFVPNVDNARNAVAGVKSSGRTRIVFNCPVVVAVLDLLRKNAT